MISKGTVIGERYEVVQHIGRGGMQEVYLAHDLLLGIFIALKTPQTNQGAKRFKASAQIAARVNHHNVAKTLDCFEENGVEYLAEEFVEGETLDEKLKQFGCLDPHLGARVLHHLIKGVVSGRTVIITIVGGHINQPPLSYALYWRTPPRPQ